MIWEWVQPKMMHLPRRARRSGIHCFGGGGGGWLVMVERGLCRVLVKEGRESKPLDGRDLVRRDVGRVIVVVVVVRLQEVISRRLC